MQAYKFRLKIFLALFLVVMTLGIVTFMILEGRSVTDSIYYTIVTVATVGYGDISPATTAGKFLAIAIIILGSGTFLGVIANATEIMLSKREEQSRREKLHIVMGLFFSEIGMKTLQAVSRKDRAIGGIRERLAGVSSWNEKDIAEIKDYFRSHSADLDPDAADFEYLKSVLKESKNLLIQLLENPVVVEHELFTDILRATFHLYEELSHRKDLGDLPDHDREHLKGDIKRMYGQLIIQWVDYIRYLKGNYPYLFSFAVRTNPFVEG